MSTMMREDFTFCGKSHSANQTKYQPISVETSELGRQTCWSCFKRSQSKRAHCLKLVYWSRFSLAWQTSQLKTRKFVWSLYRRSLQQKVHCLSASLSIPAGQDYSKQSHDSCNVSRSLRVWYQEQMKLQVWRRERMQELPSSVLYKEQPSLRKSKVSKAKGR